MKRYVFDTEEEWLSARQSLFTSSQVNKLMAEPTAAERKAGEQLSKGAKTYIDECIVGILANPEQQYYNSEMQRGKDLEPQAVFEFAKYLGKSVNDDDFIYTSLGGIVFFTDDDSIYGGTPDIIIGNKIAEIKCPKSITHLRNRRLKTVEAFKDLCPDYYDQIQLNIHLTDAEGAWFISYDDRFKDEAKHLFVLDIPKDEQRIKELIDKIEIASNYMSSLLENEL